MRAGEAAGESGAGPLLVTSIALQSSERHYPGVAFGFRPAFRGRPVER